MLLPVVNSAEAILHAIKEVCLLDKSSLSPLQSLSAGAWFSNNSTLCKQDYIANSSLASFNKTIF